MTSQPKSSLRLFGLLTALFFIMALLTASAAMADEEGKGCPNPSGRPTSNLVEAWFTPSGSVATYYFKSVDAGGTEGVPGLKAYCVYPGTLPDSVTVNNGSGGAVGWDGSFWTDPGAPPDAFYFDEATGAGNKANIPFDGTTRTMGTATWSGSVPTTQTILLHIADETECNELGAPAETCFVLPGEIATPAADLTATKTAEPSLKRTFTWEIEKEADQTNVNIAEGEKATIEYTVIVKHDEGTDSNWAVSGEIVVNNPNSGAVTGVNVEDFITDTNASCEVEGGEDAEIPAEGNESFEYTCEYSAEPESESETNTATVTWPEQTVDGHLLAEGKTEAEAEVDWGSADVEVIDGEVEVEDSFKGFLKTVSWEDPSEEKLTYTREIEGVPGTCETYDNTAKFTTNDTATTGEDEETVEVCVGKDLEIEKNATPSFKRTFGWEIEKEADQTNVNIAEGEKATIEYTVIVKHDTGTDSGWLVKGKITVNNPNDWESIEVDVADEIENEPNTECTVTNGENVVISAGGSEEFEYECDYSAAPADEEQTNRATVTWNEEEASTPSGSKTATAAIDWGATEPEIVDGEVEVEDTFGGELGTVSYTDPSPQEFKYSHEFEGVAGTCTEYDNTATFQSTDEGSETQGSDEETVTVCVGADLEVEKDATPSFKRTFEWEIEKEADKTSVTGQEGGSATFTYTIKVTKGVGTDSEWLVKGKITVTNPNDWESIEADVADEIVGDSNAECTVSEGEDTVIAAGETAEFDYECTYKEGPASEEQKNKATATWDPEAAFTPNGSASGEADVDWSAIEPTKVDDCATVTDTLDGVPTAFEQEPCESGEYTLEATFKIESGCVTHTNTATVVGNDTETSDEDSVEVDVCGFSKTGALTMGFWQNKNGQKIITGQQKSGVCPSGTWLRQYNPFKDLNESATCKQVAEYVTNVIKAASAGGASMNAMLKAQMLATALDVYFSDPLLGGNKIGAPAPVGDFVVDLTKVCKDIPTCSVFEDTSAAFGGATSMTVSKLLEYAAGKSGVGGTPWYGQDKALQELAKDTFDAINNQVAFGP